MVRVVLILIVMAAVSFFIGVILKAVGGEKYKNQAAISIGLKILLFLIGAIIVFGIAFLIWND